MGVLWMYRQQFSHLFFRSLAKNTFENIRMANHHVKALQSPYLGTTDVQVRRFSHGFFFLISHLFSH